MGDVTNLSQLDIDDHDGATVGLKLAGELILGDARDLGAIHVIEQACAFGDFTDVTTTGTLALDVDIPQGAFVVQTVLDDLVGFAGDTSAVITVGDGSDVDRYNTGTPDVFTTVAGGIPLGVPAGVQYHAAAKTPTIIITTAADFSSVSAGSFNIRIFYLL